MIADALGLGLGFAGALAIVVTANLFSLLPAAPGYAGTFDAGVLAALATLGTDIVDRLPYLLLLRGVLFVPITLTGLVVLLTAYGPWSPFRAISRRKDRGGARPATAAETPPSVPVRGD